MPANPPAPPNHPAPVDEIARLRADREELLAAVAHWRAVALDGWAQEPAPVTQDGEDSAEAVAEAAHWRREVEAMRQTLSWRITTPLRAVRRAGR